MAQKKKGLQRLVTTPGLLFFYGYELNPQYSCCRVLAYNINFPVLNILCFPKEPQKAFILHRFRY